MTIYEKKETNINKINLFTHQFNFILSLIVDVYLHRFKGIIIL